jgi:hypothetical protein
MIAGSNDYDCRLLQLFAAISSVNYGKIKQHMGFVSFLPLVFGLMGIGYLYNRSVIKLGASINRTGSVWHGVRTFNAQYVDLAHDYRT